MALIVGGLLGLLYVWLRGWWFSAVVMMLVGAGLAFVIGNLADPPHNHSPATILLFMAVAGAAAWLPYWFHRSTRRQATRSLAGVQLVRQDAPFNG